MGAILYQKVIIFDILGARFPPCTDSAKRTHVPIGHAKLNRCNESPLWGVGLLTVNRLTG